MKKMVLMVLLVFLGLGCSMIRINTNIPFFYDYCFDVINSSSYNIEVLANGKKVKFLQPGENYTLKLKNYGNRTAEIVVSVKAWQEKIIGAASRKVYIYGNQQQADSWIIHNETFTYQNYWY